jgi:hypothetical protein
MSHKRSLLFDLLSKKKIHKLDMEESMIGECDSEENCQNKAPNCFVKIKIK